jgi:hypothetical protein
MCPRGFRPANRQPPNQRALPMERPFCLALERSRLLHHRRHTPRRRSIQYAASSRFHHRRLEILDRPPSGTMTLRVWRPRPTPSLRALAKQSKGHKEVLDCFRLHQTATADRSSQALLAMTLMVRSATSHSRDAMRPSFANSFRPPKNRGRNATLKRGRGEDRVRAAPAVSCANAYAKKLHTSIQVQRKQSGLPCAMVLRLISCSPRRDLACLSPSSPRSLLLRNLTPAIGASGPHDFAVRVTRCSSKAHPRPPLPAPRQ